jgi:hypothetical protein
MPRKRHTSDQIIRKLREAEVELARDLTTGDVVRVSPDAEEDFQVEGAFSVSPNDEPPGGSEPTGRFAWW